MTLTEEERLAHKRQTRTLYYLANKEKVKLQRRQRYLRQKGAKWRIKFEEFEKAVHSVLDRQTTHPQSTVNLYQIVRGAMRLVGIPRQAGGLYRSLNSIAEKVILARGGMLWASEDTNHRKVRIYEFPKVTDEEPEEEVDENTLQM